MNKEQFLSLTVDDILCSYSAKKEGCRCGCLGKYSYNSKHIELAGKDRGYKIQSKEVNDKQITKVLKLMKDNFDELEFTDDEIINFPMAENRIYTLYTIQAARGF